MRVVGRRPSVLSVVNSGMKSSYGVKIVVYRHGEK